MARQADITSAEHALCALALSDPSVVQDAGVDSSLFGDPWAQWLWSLIESRMSRGLSVAVLDLAPLCTAQELPGLDGAWLADIYTLGSGFVRADMTHLANRVRQDATRRNLVAAATRIQQMAEHAPPEEVDGIVEMARKEVDSCFTPRGDIVMLGDRLEDVISDLALESKSPIPTPWTGLNHLINGWQGGRLYTIAAATGFGKSICALNIARGLAEHGVVSFSSLEMTVEEIIHRFIAHETMIDLGSLTKPPISDAAMRQIQRKKDQMMATRIAIDDRPNVTISDIEHQAREVLRTHGSLAGIIVDYIQVVRWDGPKSVVKREQLASMSWRLKALSKELDVPVFQLAQVNRAGQMREGNEPTMNDLRDSADLENNSDVIVMGWIPDEDIPEDAWMKVAKARGWPKGKWPVRRSGQYALIDNAGF